MTKTEYKEYMQTEHWRDTREAAICRAHDRCQVCGDTEGKLNAHHNTYVNLWDEQPEDLVVLCRECHVIFHGNGKIKVMRHGPSESRVQKVVLGRLAAAQADSRERSSFAYGYNYHGRLCY